MRFGPLLALMAPLCACTSNADTSTDTGPTGPPAIAFANPAPGAPACRAIGSDVQAHVPLLLSVTNVVLRPPADCGTFVQCGFLRLSVDGRVNNEGAALAIDLLAGELANPYRTVNVTVDVRQIPVSTDANGNVLLGAEAPLPDANGQPLTTSTQLVIAATCP